MAINGHNARSLNHSGNLSETRLLVRDGTPRPAPRQGFSGLSRSNVSP